MARSYDFTKSKKNKVKAQFGFVCAACGADDPQGLSVDHWVAGDKSDSGVCLCVYCNSLKGDLSVPDKLRLQPREALKVITHREYQSQVAENRAAWGKWVRAYAGKNRVKPIAFIAPY